jgi:hypothetical protein
MQEGEPFLVTPYLKETVIFLVFLVTWAMVKIGTHTNTHTHQQCHTLFHTSSFGVNTHTYTHMHIHRGWRSKTIPTCSSWRWSCSPCSRCSARLSCWPVWMRVCMCVCMCAGLYGCGNVRVVLVSMGATYTLLYSLALCCWPRLMKIVCVFVMVACPVH